MGKKAWIGVFDRDSKFKPELLNVCYRKEESEDSLGICFELPIMKRSSKECIEEVFHINPLW